LDESLWSDFGAFTCIAPPSDSGSHIRIADVTEYFLVGSFASWIAALGGLSPTVPH